jgi:single-strand DNA-binding protein
MNDVNVVCLTGNLTKDVELRQAGDSAVTTLRLAVTGRRKVQGEWSDVPNYFDVTVWGNQAESAATYLQRGSRVAVTGRLEWREWLPDDSDVKRQAVQVVADNVVFLGGLREQDPASVA